MADDIKLPDVMSMVRALEHTQRPARPVALEMIERCIEDYARAAVEACRVQQAAEIERLREDAARLDWLDAKNARFRIGWRVGQAPIGNVNVHAIVQLGSGALTGIRAAIDAAMREPGHA